jgi:ATP-dependent DNA helicase DinG
VPDLSDLPDVQALLSAAVAEIGGAERPGQTAMATAVEHALSTGEHLAVQAGTGTGKSLAYLVPALRHAMADESTVVVSTATIALQRQLIDRDLPRLATALTPLLGREPRFAILKGRRNYLCLHRLQTGPPEDPADGLFEPTAVSAMGRQVKRLHEWADETTTGDRDELVPGVGESAWRQVAVSARECLGAQRCPYGTECFAELARAEAAAADIVVTNHALLAIAALEDYPVLPEHDAVVIDEAHELVDRVTSVATGELSATAVETAAKRCGRLIDDEHADRLHAAGEGLAPILDEAPTGRMDVLAEAVALSLAAVRDAAHGVLGALRPVAKGEGADPEQAGVRKAALAAVTEVHDTAARVLGAFEEELADRPDVVWLSRDYSERRRWPPTLRVAPVAVGGLLRSRLFARRTTVLTSATLSLGGSFDALARQWGLPPEGTVTDTSGAAPAAAATSAGSGGTVEPGSAVTTEAGAPVAVAGASGSETAARRPAGAEPEQAPAADPTSGAGADRTAEGGADGTSEPAERSLAWTGLDVGSPFDHARSGILYVARHLPPPGRDGLPESYLAELAELIDAAGGRTLGLFSSMRAARKAADELGDRIAYPVLCQGDDSTALLVGKFAADHRSCLFGTLSLWQGVDVPGPALQLVVVDRIPFPRPDDPVASARQRAVAARGGNGFMTVAATHAALLLAQGTGRLLRTASDRGVVAVLDPRLSTARYGGFLRASLPPYWTTTDPGIARAALRRIDEGAAPESAPEPEPTGGTGDADDTGSPAVAGAGADAS